MHKRGVPGPTAGFVGRKMRAPFVAGLRRRFGSVAIGSKVAGDIVSGGARFVAEFDGQSIIAKWVGRVIRLVTFRAVKTERDLVPLLELAGKVGSLRINDDGESGEEGWCS